MHVIWATGWYIGLNQEFARQAFQQRWFLVYDLIVAGICAIAVIVALALVQRWGQRLPFWLVSLLAWTGAVLLSLGTVVGMLRTIYLAYANGEMIGIPFGNVWTCLGAVLFGVVAWRFGRSSRKRPPARS